MVLVMPRKIGLSAQFSHFIGQDPQGPVEFDALIDAVMQVHLPVRSIFARPQVPLAKLLSLRAGDVIPVCLPDFLPVTVAGRQFAHGTVGEAGGRAAIKINSIESLQKGLPHHA